MNSSLFSPGELVRYRSDGPRGAKLGHIGVVRSPSQNSGGKGWVRVDFSGFVEEFAADELERVHYWAFASRHPTEWAGPYGDWRLAQLAVQRMIIERSCPASNSPLEAKQQELVQTLAESEPSRSGIKVWLEMGGEFGIIPGVKANPHSTIRMAKNMLEVAG